MEDEIEEHFPYVQVTHPSGKIHHSEKSVDRGWPEMRDPSGVIQAALGAVADHSDVIHSLRDRKVSNEGQNQSRLSNAAPAPCLPQLLSNGFSQGVVLGRQLGHLVCGRLVDEMCLEAILNGGLVALWPSPVERSGAH